MSYEEFLLQAESSREDNIAPENLPLIVDQHDAISVASDIHHTQNEAYNTVAYDRSEIREDSNEESYPGHKSNLLSLNTPYSKLARSSENNRSISDTNIEKAGSELPTACTGFTKTIKHEDQLRTINILRSMSDGNVNQTCSLDKMHRNTTDLSSTHSMNRRTPNHKISKTSLSRQSSENSFENLRKLGLCGSQGSLSHYSSRKSLSHHSSRRSLSHHSSGKSIRTYFRRNIRNQSSNKSLRFQANSSSNVSINTLNLDGENFMLGTTKVDINERKSEIFENLTATTIATLDQTEILENFVETEGFRAVETKLQSHGIVIITGGFGMGKSTIGIQLLKRFSKSDDDRYPTKAPIILRFPRDWHVAIEPKKDVIVLLDDIFGKRIANLSRISEWENVFPDIHTCIKADNMSVYVIICVRNNILRNICTDLKEFELFSEIDELIVNISDTDYLSYEDKKMLLTTYLDTLEDIDTNQLREEILKVQCPFAFPLCCRKFVNKPAYLSYGSNFFKQPIGVVLPVIERLCKYDKYLLVLFALILFSDLQTVNIEDIYITSIDEDRKIEQLSRMCGIQDSVDIVFFNIKAKISEWSDIYVSTNVNFVFFKHPILLEIVINLFYRTNSKYVIENLDFALFDIFSTIYLLQDQTTLQIMYDKYLIKRFVKKLSSGCMKDVAICKFMMNESFVDKLISHLKLEGTFNSIIEKSDGFGTLLYYTMSSNPPNYELMKKIVDGCKKKKQLKDIYINLKRSCSMNQLDSFLILCQLYQPLPKEILF